MVVAEKQRIMVYLSSQLLAQLDEICHEEKINRSEIVREAMHLYIMERTRRILREQLKEGYQLMAELNLRLAEEYSCDEIMITSASWRRLIRVQCDPGRYFSTQISTRYRFRTGGVRPVLILQNDIGTNTALPLLLRRSHLELRRRNFLLMWSYLPRSIS